MLQIIKKFIKDEEGASAVEYGLIAGLIAVALVVVLGVLTDGFSDVFNYIVTAFPS
jgi:pilus assembly protein Flp/PilA